MSTPLIATLDASNCNLGNPCLYKPQVFTAVVTLTVEEWNRIQNEMTELRGEIATLKAELAKPRETVEDFDTVWNEVIRMPNLTKLWRSKGNAHLWFVPAFEPDVPEFRVKPSLRKVLGWPDHNCDLVTNFKCLYNSDRSSDMYKKFTALVTAKPPPASNQTRDAGSS